MLRAILVLLLHAATRVDGYGPGISASLVCIIALAEALDPAETPAALHRAAKSEVLQWHPNRSCLAAIDGDACVQSVAPRAAPEPPRTP